MQRNSAAGLSLRLPVMAAFALLIFATPSKVCADPAVAAAHPDASMGLRNEEQQRHQRQQEYIREHSDAKGKMHADAYVKGMEHVRHMKVAPYIGAKPLGEASPTATK